MNDQDKFPYVIESKKLRDIHYVKYPDYKYYNHKKVQFYDRDFNNNSTPFIPLMYIDSPSNGNNVEDDTILDPSIMGIYLSRQDILYLLKNEHEFHEYFPAVSKSQNTRVTRSKGVKNEQEVIFDTVSDENVFEESDAN
uniref:ATS domain-containing protein n=1 Tax=Rhabditophanes sp. KR3021 TaxID=114890 RepID=A0AC35TVG9_9BILA